MISRILPLAALVVVSALHAQPLGRSEPSFSQPSLAPGVDYVVPSEAGIQASLDAIRGYFQRSTPYRIVDTQTGQEIADLAHPTKTAGVDLRPGQFNDWDYPMGVVRPRCSRPPT